MLKKSALLLAVGCFSIFALTGCGEENAYTPADDYPYEEEYNPAYEGYIPDITMQQPNEYYHIVAADETLVSIAEMYGLDPDFLIEFNGLDSEMDIFLGLLLMLPEGTVIIETSEYHHIPEIDVDVTLTLLPENLDFEDNYISWNYAVAREMEFEGVHLMIQSPTLLSSFAFIDVEPFNAELDFAPSAIDVLFYAGDLEPNVRFLIHDFFMHSSFPRTGFTFIDETGTRRFFTVFQSMASGDYYFAEFYQDDFAL